MIRLRAWSQGDLEVEEVVGVCAVCSATDAALVRVGAARVTTASSRFLVSVSAAVGSSLITFAFGNGCCGLDQADCSCTEHARTGGWLLRLLCLPAQLGVQAVDFSDERERERVPAPSTGRSVSLADDLVQ